MELEFFDFGELENRQEHQEHWGQLDVYLLEEEVASCCWDLPKYYKCGPVIIIILNEQQNFCVN